MIIHVFSSTSPLLKPLLFGGVGVLLSSLNFLFFYFFPLDVWFGLSSLFWVVVGGVVAVVITSWLRWSVVKLSVFMGTTETNKHESFYIHHNSRSLGLGMWIVDLWLWSMWLRRSSLVGGYISCLVNWIAYMWIGLLYYSAYCDLILSFTAYWIREIYPRHR